MQCGVVVQSPRYRRLMGPAAKALSVVDGSWTVNHLIGAPSRTHRLLPRMIGMGSRRSRRYRRLVGPAAKALSAVDGSWAANQLTGAPRRPHRPLRRTIGMESQHNRRHDRPDPVRSRGVVNVGIEWRGVVGTWVLSRGVAIRSCAANQLTPVRPHRFVHCGIVVLSRPPQRIRRLNGHRFLISSSAVRRPQRTSSQTRRSVRAAPLPIGIILSTSRDARVRFSGR